MTVDHIIIKLRSVRVYVYMSDVSTNRKNVSDIDVDEVLSKKNIERIKRKRTSLISFILLSIIVSRSKVNSEGEEEEEEEKEKNVVFDLYVCSFAMIIIIVVALSSSQIEGREEGEEKDWEDNNEMSSFFLLCRKENEGEGEERGRKRMHIC